MFRSIDDFTQTWTTESAATLKVMQGLTDAALARAVDPEGRTLGRLAWHLTLTLGEMLGHTGLTVTGPSETSAVPGTVEDIAAAYEAAARQVLDQIQGHWSDDTLLAQDEMYGEKWQRGATLFALVVHQAHHRGQMTVLMRQAGLKVPGVYGPAREEWVAFGMPAPQV